MKKLAALVLTLMLIAACIPAFALDANDVFGAIDRNNMGSWSAPYNHNEWKKVCGVELKKEAKISASVYDENGELFINVINQEEYPAGYLVVNWPAVNSEGWHPGPNVDVTYSVKITAEIAGESVTIEEKFPFHFAHDISMHYNELIKWYPKNTACVAGLEFREVKPSLTNKWWNFAAVDLSRVGEQVFEYVASNKYVVGSVIVKRDGDIVTVEWKLNKQGTTDANFKTDAEFLTFFHDIDSVESVNPSEIHTSYKFGQPISISNDLNGDTNVLLYVLNTVSYCSNLSYEYQKPIFHPAYDRNVSFRVARRMAMTELMQMEAQ